MVSKFFEIINREIQQKLEYKNIEIIDLNRLTPRDIGKYFIVYTSSNFLTNSIGSYTARNNLIFVFVIDKNRYLQEIERIASFFLSLKNQSEWFQNTTDYLLEITSLTTANKQYFSLGVELVYIEMVLYTNLQG